MKTKKKITSKVMALAAAMYALLGATFCDIPGLSEAKDLVFEITTWGGGIILVAGLAMIGKSIMDATSGQAQPGQLGKAIGVTVLGLILLAAKTIVSQFGA